jgi:hypothetical protein
MKFVAISTTLAILFCANAALAQTPAAPAPQNPHTGAMAGSMPAGSMPSSAGHTKETKMDKTMVKNCMTMPKDKMMQDAECQDYMKNHPDWMKTKK